MKSTAFLQESLAIAFESIKSNKLRSILTMAIIAIGIMALVGIFTAIDALKNTVTNSFSSMGANNFTILTRMNVNINGRKARSINFDYIPYSQALEFKERYDFPSDVALKMSISRQAVIKYNSNKTNPNISLIGADENLLRILAIDVSQGRAFSKSEVENANMVIVLGSALVKTLFDTQNPIDKYVSIAGGQYRVVGILASQGGGMGGQGADRTAYIPITTARNNFAIARPDVPITVKPRNVELMPQAQSEAEALFRKIRGLTPSDENDFALETSDSIIKMLLESMSNVTIAASLIGFITLFGAAIGLMNIMLVSVGERTREIGTRKALGAKPSAIRMQFLLESILISQMGGIIGIVLGILMGNVVSVLTKSPFFVPWGWVFFGVTLCLIVGVASGYIPAKRAANMDPVDALRYE